MTLLPSFGLALCGCFLYVAHLCVLCALALAAHPAACHDAGQAQQGGDHKRGEQLPALPSHGRAGSMTRPTSDLPRSRYSAIIAAILLA